VGDAASGRGGAFYDDDRTHAAYLAHRHSGTASPNTVMEEPGFLAALGPVAGLRVLDLGCGDGSFATHALDRGAISYLGIDGSKLMISTAERDHGSDRAKFAVGDIEDLVTEEGAVDVVTSRMALHYVEHLAPVLATVRRALVPGGRLVVSVVHPVITSHDEAATGPRTSWTVDNYFVPGPRVRTWFDTQVTWYHRTIEQYARALRAAGFTLTELSECEPDERLLIDDVHELARRRRVPLMLVLAAHTA
jgi:ubiquinone/menaquinone biosynthesis C-methylase UbiE